MTYFWFIAAAFAEINTPRDLNAFADVIFGQKQDFIDDSLFTDDMGRYNSP
jgi:hypothetical protein